MVINYGNPDYNDYFNKQNKESKMDIISELIKLLKTTEATITMDCDKVEITTINGTKVTFTKMDNILSYLRSLKPALKVDTPIIVWNNKKEKFHRYFSHWDKNGEPVVFVNGRTSWSIQKHNPYISNSSCVQFLHWELPKGVNND